MKPKTYILWLPSWYPNQLQPFNGDFVQRHARATALHVDIEVIHVVKDEEGRITKAVHTETHRNGQLTETIIYYYFPKRFPGFINRWLSHRRYVQLYQQAIQNLVNDKGRPHLLHVYISLKAGMLAPWCRRRFGLRYVVGEQSTVYLREARPNFQNLNPWFQKAAATIFRQANGVMVVSQYLSNALVQQFGIRPPVVIPNVVDERIFHPEEKRIASRKTFIHISNLTYQKNAEAMLEAFRLVKEKGLDFHLHVVGPEVTALQNWVAGYSLRADISFHHEMPQPELATLIRASDALVLFSRYETFGCVIIEAFACGLPVILSDIPVFHENAGTQNALFAENEKATALSEAIIKFITGAEFDRNKISAAALAQYNFNKVGRQMVEWYEKILSSG